jgi:hypothetical protein
MSSKWKLLVSMWTAAEAAKLFWLNLVLVVLFFFRNHSGPIRRSTFRSLWFRDTASLRQRREFEKREFDPALALTWLPATLSRPMGEGEYQRQSAFICG